MHDIFDKPPKSSHHFKQSDTDIPVSRSYMLFHSWKFTTMYMYKGKVKSVAPLVLPTACAKPIGHTLLIMRVYGAALHSV